MELGDRERLQREETEQLVASDLLRWALKAWPVWEGAGGNTKPVMHIGVVLVQDIKYKSDCNVRHLSIPIFDQSDLSNRSILPCPVCNAGVEPRTDKTGEPRRPTKRIEQVVDFVAD